MSVEVASWGVTIVHLTADDAKVIEKAVAAATVVAGENPAQQAEEGSEGEAEGAGFLKRLLGHLGGRFLHLTVHQPPCRRLSGRPRRTQWLRRNRK